MPREIMFDNIICLEIIDRDTGLAGSPCAGRGERLAGNVRPHVDGPSPSGRWPVSARERGAAMMADASDGAAGERVQCSPCRGTGKVMSSLGGLAHEVTCPWCGGAGSFQPGRDAQASPAEGGEAS